MENFDEDRLRRNLVALAPWKRVVFMLSCCARMVPNYEEFSAETGFGNTCALKQAMILTWTWLETDIVPQNLENVRRQVESITPDTEDFSSPFTSAALDAACSVAYLLDAIEAPAGTATLDLAIEVATLARDTVDLYIQNLEDLRGDGLEAEETVLPLPLMQRELQNQQLDIDLLKNWNGTKREGVERFQIVSANGLAGSLHRQAN